jgi:hypothetical protein
LLRSNLKKKKKKKKGKKEEEKRKDFVREKFGSSPDSKKKKFGSSLVKLDFARFEKKREKNFIRDHPKRKKKKKKRKKKSLPDFAGIIVD